jgi:hypothetical protein
MSEIADAMRKLLPDASDKNYDPRMEELLRSDRLIDPKYENMSILEDQEIYSIAKLRGAQKAFAVPVRKIKKIYDLPEMQPYHAPWIDYIRALDENNEHDKLELDASVGGLPMINEMIYQLIYLRGSREGTKLKIYADSIKPAVANNPPMMQQPEPQEGVLSKIIGFFVGKKQENPSPGYKQR